MALAFCVLDGQTHDRKGFSCGVPALDDYIRNRAQQHQRDGISTTHVLVNDDEPAIILGYCALSAAQLHLTELQENDRRRLPNYPIPAVRMGRLAVSASEHGKGFGKLLVGHAVNLALSIRLTVGVRVLIVDAKDSEAAAFYEGYGFRRTANDALTLYLPIRS